MSKRARHPRILDRNNAALLVIDVQEKFREHIHNYPEMVKNIVTLVEASKVLRLPVVVTEQYPKGLGSTIPEISTALADYQLAEHFHKDCFSCCGLDAFNDSLSRLGRNQIIVAGIEAHVCVSQTVHDLIDLGYQPHIVVDAISSRFSYNKEIGIEKMISSGALPSSVEMALFEMLVNSGTETFKAVQRLVK